MLYTEQLEIPSTLIRAKELCRRKDITTVDTHDEIYKACTRFLGGHYRQTPQQVLSDLAASVDPGMLGDRYGEGEIINHFEAEVAALLGKEAAVFMPSGTMCQQIALRIWCDRRKVSNVAFHPTCHLEIHEQHGYQRLHNLQSILLGSPYRLFTLDDLKNVKEPLGALLIELPQREIGGQLPSWEALAEIISWGREQGIPMHLDGARLWESQPFYKRSYAEIAALFDTVYVSFYKILGGIAGAVMAATSYNCIPMCSQLKKALPNACRAWKPITRRPGQLPPSYPPSPR